MKNLRKQFNLFCYKNRDKGIPNLMLYIMLGTAVVYLLSDIAGNYTLYNLLIFDRQAILHGQIWRLISYPLTFRISNPFLMLLSGYCYYFLGRAMESAWGTFKFNLFYFTGMIMMDIYCLLFGGRADVSYLNLSLFLSFATMAPDAGFLLFFIIPVKAWIFALVDLGSVFIGLVTNPFPYNLFPVISLANYFLFFGKDVLNLVPLSFRNWLRRKFGKKPATAARPKVIEFQAAPPRQERPKSDPNKPAYTHRCTVCGKTDVTHPDLEFRYCSKCRSYFCYCEDHISNHEHIV